MKNVSSVCKSSVLNGAFQEALIVVSPLTGNSFTLNNNDLTLNGFKLERHSVDKEELQVGNFSAAMLELTLDNFDGRFNDVFFGGAVLDVRIGIPCGTYTEYIRMGKFTVDEQPRRLSTITLSAFDNAVQLDRPYPIVESERNVTARVLSRELVEHCGLICNNYTMFDNSLIFKLPAGFGKDMTCRQALMRLCETEGINGFVNSDGHVVFKWYSSPESFEISESLRYTSDTEESAVTVNGVSFIDGNESYSIDGEYIIQIKNNPFFVVVENKNTILNRVNSRVGGFTYLGYNCECRSLPFLEPLDIITYVKNEVKNKSIITNYTFTLNSKTELSAKCVSLTKKKYGSLGVLTPEQKAVIKNIADDITKAGLSDMQQAQLDLNEAIANSMGLYQTTVKQPDNSVKVYRHNKPLLEESDIIYTMTENGFAWTTSGWNGGKPVWHYGVNKDGNAVLNAINTYKLVADLIVAGRLQSKDGASFFDLDTGIAQFLGEFTAKSQSYDPSLDVSATLRGFKVDSSNPDENEGTPAGLYFEDTNSNIFAHLIGVLLGKWKILQLGVNNEEGDTASMIQLTSSGVATVQDSSGSGQIFHTGNLLIESGIADMTGHFWQGNGGWDGMITVYPKSGKLFTSNAVPVVSVNTSWAHAFQAGCKRPSFDGSFEIWCHASNVYSSAPAVSVSWLLTEVKA